MTKIYLGHEPWHFVAVEHIADATVDVHAHLEAFDKTIKKKEDPGFLRISRIPVQILRFGLAIGLPWGMVIGKV